MLRLSRLSSSGRFAGDPLKVTRVIASYFDDTGQLVTNTEDLFIKATVQPELNQLNFMPQGQVLNDIIRIWSNDPLIQGDDQQTMSDMVTWQGNNYKIIKSINWGDNGFYKAWAERVITSDQ